MATAPDIKQQVYDLLSRTSNLSFISADQESDAGIGPSLIPGQRVTAEVLATLTDSRVQVRIGSERFNLNLPMAVRQGQTLEMTFVSDSPRSTFAIARPASAAPPISLSDASRLLGLLVGNEQIVDPGLRTSLQSIGDMLRSSSGEVGVLANLMDEALTYGGIPLETVKTIPPPLVNVGQLQDGGEQEVLLQQPGSRTVTPEQARLATFESNAAQMLQHIARNSRFTMIEAVNQPVVPLPLMPGEEVDAAVTGSLPGGRAFVKVAGTALELMLPRSVEAGELLRLTYISSQPKPLFALARSTPGVPPGVLSETGRWLSALEHSAGGASSQQLYVLERLNTVLKSLPPDSPAFSAILDEAITYEKVLRGGQQAEQNAAAGAAATAVPQAPLQLGSGIVLSDDMAKLLHVLIKGSRLALLEVLNQQAAPTGFVPGQQLKGELLASLGGGRFMVQVAGQMLEFSMPKGMRRGDLANLFFISEEPRLTFLLARFGGPGDSRVSDTGRWLSGFLGAVAERLPAQSTLSILRTLLSGPPVDARQVGTVLQFGLRESGLFYESHLARWFEGDYALEDILREPQGRLSHLLRPLTGQIAGTPAEEPLRAGMKYASMEAMEAVFKKAGTAMANEGIADPRSLTIVREQLETLQTGQVVYRGELFPGQTLEWTVKERDARRNSAGDQERGWDTTMRLDLPRLGGITACLTLNGNRIGIALNVDDAASAIQLAAGRPELIEQLQAAGLTPGEIGVSHEDA